jgi:enoyl-CoA hydratase/carnithine racemase
LRVDGLGPALRLTLVRAAQRNALDGELLAALEMALATAAADQRPALILTAEGGVFSSGMDFGAVSALAGRVSSRPLHQAFARVLGQLAQLPALTLALVDGDALGGGLALAAACDVVIATDAARFGLPEALWGLLPANAAPVVARRVGLQAARRLALTTESIGTAEALRLGLADYHVADRDVAVGLLRRLCLRAGRVGPAGIASVKTCFRRLAEDPAGYGDWALDAITASADDPALRQRLAVFLAGDTN